MKELQLLFFVVFKGGGGVNEMLEGLESASRPHPALSCRLEGREGASRVCFMSSSVCSLPFPPSHLQILVTSLQNKRPRVTFQQNILAAWLKTKKKKKKKRWQNISLSDALIVILIGCCFMWVI